MTLHSAYDNGFLFQETRGTYQTPSTLKIGTNIDLSAANFVSYQSELGKLVKIYRELGLLIFSLKKIKNGTIPFFSILGNRKRDNPGKNRMVGNYATDQDL